MASSMSSEAVGQNGGSSIIFLLAASGLTFLFYNYMNRNHFLQANFGILSRLACELTLLAVVIFTAAVGVLSIYHTRVGYQRQQLSAQGAVTGRTIASPLGFAFE